MNCYSIELCSGMSHYNSNSCSISSDYPEPCVEKGNLCPPEAFGDQKGDKQEFWVANGCGESSYTYYEAVLIKPSGSKSLQCVGL